MIPQGPRNPQEMMRRMQEMHRQQKAAPQEQQATPKPKTNPLPKNDEGYRRFREENNCVVATTTMDINELLQGMREHVKSGKVTQDMGLIAQHAACAEDVCLDNKKERIVADLTKDELSSRMHEKILIAQKEMQEIHQQLVEKSHALEALHLDRWDRIVKSHGLDPIKYHYFLDDENGKVYQTELDCDTCTSNVELQRIHKVFEDICEGDKPND